MRCLPYSTPKGRCLIEHVVSTRPGESLPDSVVGQEQNAKLPILRQQLNTGDVRFANGSPEAVHFLRGIDTLYDIGDARNLRVLNTKSAQIVSEIGRYRVVLRLSQKLGLDFVRVD